MRSLALLALLLTGTSPAMADDGIGISSILISRCAERIGLDVRSHDPAFGVLAIDGIPWVTIERTEDKVGSQPISTTITGTGGLRQRRNTVHYWRYTCRLDAKDQVEMVHVSQLENRGADQLPPANFVAGTATFREKLKLPSGSELRLQLLDTSAAPAPEVLVEQIVLSAWEVPIPFELRVPKPTSLKDRKLLIAARLVLGDETLFRLARPLAADDLERPVELVLDKAAPTGR